VTTAKAIWYSDTGYKAVQLKHAEQHFCLHYAAW